MQPASFATQVMDIVELKHHETVKIVMDPNSLWEVRDVDADYKAVEYNGRCSDIHTYHQLHIGHGFSLLMAHQGYHAPQMVNVNGVGRYNLIWEAGNSYPLPGTLYYNWPIPEEKEYLDVPELVVANDSNMHDFLDYHANVAQIKTINDVRHIFNGHIDREYIHRGLRPGERQSSHHQNRYGSIVMFTDIEHHIPLGVQEMYVIPHTDEERSQGIIFSSWDLPQMHRDIDNGILMVGSSGIIVWSENG